MPLVGNCTFSISDDGLTLSHQYEPEDARSIAEHMLAALALPPPPPPPPPSPVGIVVLQSGFTGPEGSAAFSDNTGRHIINGNRKADGLWSWNESFGGWIADSDDWDLGDVFTIEYRYRQSNVASTYDILTNASGAGQTGWTVRHAAANLTFAWFDPTGVHHAVYAPQIGWGAMTEHLVRIERSAGEFRFFVDGEQKPSASNSAAIRPSAQTLKLNISGAGQQAWLRSLAITKGS